MTNPCCPICACSAQFKAHGILAPFVSKLIGSRITSKVSLFTCELCDFDFFDRRYSQHEADALYSGYREKKYFETRRSWEPWYSKSVNNAYVPASAQVDIRVSFMTRILSRTLKDKTLDNVVDVGGDEGQFFPPFEIRKRIVIDISNKKLRPDVERVPNIETLKVKADLMIVANLLEHLSEPRSFLTELKSRTVNNGYFYLEVPLDRPKVKKWHASTGYKNYLLKIQKKPLLVALDFISGLARNLGLAIPRYGIIKESEHINYFSLRSLEEIARSCDLKVIESYADEDYMVGSFKMGKAGLLAQVPGQ